jgi:hypothetical protein
MGSCAVPNVPFSRMKYVQARAIPGPPDLEEDSAVFMTDTQEWIAEDEEHKAAILAAFPDAKVLVDR